MTDEGKWIGVRGISNLLGIKPKTWTAYVSRGQAPKPDWIVEGKPLWRLHTIKEWQGQRPNKR